MLAERPVWGVRSIEYTGNRATETAELAHALDLTPGMPWWRAVGRLGIRHPGELPRVATARVRYVFPSALRVEVREREAVLRVMGESPLVAARDGMVLSADEALDPTDLPCVSGLLLQSAAGTTLDVPGAGPWWEQLMHVCSAMPELWSAISQIDCADASNIAVYLRDGRHVLLWDPHRNQHLWDQVPLVLDQLRADGLAGDAVLDMRFRDRIVVRLPEDLRDSEENPIGTESPDVGSVRASHGGDRA
ncbi:MAG: FtsQ-type POTRA domain-containing protein [Candidatus Eisenbacteria bacterium]